MQRKYIFRAAAWAATAAAALAPMLYWQHNVLQTSRYILRHPALPAAFAGTRILHLSDLHGKRFGPGQSRLTEAMRACAPHAVVITGDMIDRGDGDMAAALEAAAAAASLAPVFYVPGNHEGRCPRYPVFAERLRAHGVRVLHDEAVLLRRGAARIALCGARDPVFYAPDASVRLPLFARELDRLLHSADAPFHILLSHRPEFFRLYAACGADLAFAGHAHGGQWRLPSGRGVFAPGQGFFPAYTCGLYRRGNAVMAVSRGLGGRAPVPRLHNRPELVLVTLEPEDGEVNP